MCFTDQDAILVQKPYKFTVKLRGQQITTTKNTLQANGFTEAKWVVASKSDDSYTKREVATVQGVQQ